MTGILSLSGRDLERELAKIEKANPRSSRRRWTEDEVVVLRRLYRTTDVRAIAEALGRSVPSIENKAQEIGLHA